jgi:HEPN domain-containing protein
MKAATREWVDKAEADFAAARLVRRSRKKHSRDIVCFHLQQCVEKYLKARLEEAAIVFPRTHDLGDCLIWH